MFITSIQLVQMVVGCVVNYIVYVMKEDGLECHVSDRNIKVQLRYPNIVQQLKIVRSQDPLINFQFSLFVSSCRFLCIPAISFCLHTFSTTHTLVVLMVKVSKKKFSRKGLRSFPQGQIAQ